VLHIWQLDAQALSGDEAFSIINWTRTSLDYLLKTIAVIDPQPPIALLSLFGWVRLVGDSVFAARMLSVLFSLIAVAATYAIARPLLGRRTALIAMTIVAVNPFQLWYAQDIRSYAPWIGFSALTLACLVRAFRRPSSRANWFIYILFAILSAYAYYLEAFMLIVHNLYALTHIITQRKLIRPWILSQLTIAVALAPWYLPQFIRGGGYQPTAGGPQPILALQTFLTGSTLPPAVAHFTLIPSLPPLLTILIVILIATALIFLWQHYSLTTSILLTSASLLPTIALALLAMFTGKGYFHPRYVAASVIPLIIAVASLSSIPKRQFPYTYLAYSAPALLLLLSAISIFAYRTDPTMAKAPPWPQIIETLNEQAAPGDLILRNYPDPAFSYYYTGSIDVETLPAGENLPSDQTIAQLSELASQHDYIWFMPVESAAFDRDRVVATWLQQNAQPISEQRIGPTILLQYTLWDRVEPAHRFDTTPTFTDTVSLIGYRITPPTQHWDRSITLFIELFWNPIASSAAPLTFYVHLIGPLSPTNTPLWAQDDQPPQDGRLNTTTWLPDQPFRDVYQITIPSDAAPGAYWLTTGLYDPTTGDRITLESDASLIDTNSANIVSFTLP
jgi:hypothetical protein